MVAKVKEFTPVEYPLIRENQIILGCIHPAGHPEEVDAILKSKIDKLINMQMVAEKWYPEKIPFKENGEVDFSQFEILWKQEVEKRNCE